MSLKLGLPNENVRTALEDWCDRVLVRDFGSSIFGSSGILKDDVIVKLASAGPILNLAGLECIVGPQWPWFRKYGDELLTELLAMSIPPMVPKPTQQKHAKRPLDEGAIQQEVLKSATVVNMERNNK